MKLNTDLDLTEYLKDPLPAGTYVLEYVSDGFSNSNTIIDIHCKVLECPEHPDKVGETCTIQTCFSSNNRKIVAIGNSIRNQIFKACMGQDLFKIESQKGGINTSKLYGLKFQCFIDVKETSYGFSGNKNVYKSFKCVYTDEELLKNLRERFN